MEQKALFRLCGINFIDFWDFTPVETYEMIKIGHDKLKYDTIKHSELIMWTANAPHVQKKNKKPWTLDELLPDFAKDSISNEMSVEECERRWLEACR